MPPIDIAWVWHLHRLAPLKYAAYCRERFGAVLEPGASAFRLQTERDQASADAEDCARTREAWASAYPAEPFFWAQGSPAVDRRETSLAEPMIATALRQSTFLWQVSQPGFSDERFLAAAIERYDMFLRLMGTHGYRQHFYVPSYDVDLCWHTHMLAEPAAYLEETAERAGEPVNHDDSVNQRHKGSKLNTSWADTKKLWRKSYGGIKGTAALDAPGTCYRGEPPSWWFSDRCGTQRVQVHERVLAAEHCQELAAQLAGLAGDAVNTEADLEMSLPVPNALYDAIMSVMRVGGAAPAALAPETNTVLVPAKISRKALPLHKVTQSRACRALCVGHGPVTEAAHCVCSLLRAMALRAPAPPPFTSIPSTLTRSPSLAGPVPARRQARCPRRGLLGGALLVRWRCHELRRRRVETPCARHPGGAGALGCVGQRLSVACGVPGRCHGSSFHARCGPLMLSCSCASSRWLCVLVRTAVCACEYGNQSNTNQAQCRSIPWVP